MIARLRISNKGHSRVNHLEFVLTFIIVSCFDTQHYCFDETALCVNKHMVRCLIK